MKHKLSLLLIAAALLASLACETLTAPLAKRPVDIATALPPPTATEKPVIATTETVTDTVAAPTVETPIVDTPAADTPTSPVPTETLATAQPDCSNSVVVDLRSTNKGQYLEICANGQSYEIGPLEKGGYAVGPNNKFLVYATNSGQVYALRIGETQLQAIGDLKDLAAIRRKDEPKYAFEFTGDNPYNVVIRELVYSQDKTLVIPSFISAP